MLAACALVLDAFEIILVVIPIVMPPLLVQAQDAVWAAVLAMLALQASFLIPARRLRHHDGPPHPARRRLRSARLLWALAPFLAAQALILALCFAWPAARAPERRQRRERARRRSRTREAERLMDEAFKRQSSPP